MSTTPLTQPASAQIYQGHMINQDEVLDAQQQLAQLSKIPPPPPWRTFGKSLTDWKSEAGKIKTSHLSTHPHDFKGRGFVASESMKELVNAALCLRRPLLIEGMPGAGKTSLAYAVAQELGLPGPFRWSIVSRTRLQDGLYSYDAIGRLQETSRLRQETGETGQIETPDVGDYLRLGPMGMAFYLSKPRLPAVLLIDEIDKSDIDMPNDLLHIFEEGFFEIPELSRLKSPKADILPYRRQGETQKLKKVPIKQGFVQCQEFPLVLMTSNDAREFPPAFLRRCLRLSLQQPDNVSDFYRILNQRFSPEVLSQMDEPAKALITEFLRRIQTENYRLATDQLLNAVYLLLQGQDLNQTDRKTLLDSIFKSI